MRVFEDLLLLNDEALGSLQIHQKLIKYFEYSKKMAGATHIIEDFTVLRSSHS